MFTPSRRAFAQRPTHDLRRTTRFAVVSVQFSLIITWGRRASVVDVRLPGIAEASVVYEDETVVVFMDLNPVTPGHLLVVPRKHAVGLEDLDGAGSAHVWSVGHDMARALRRSGMRCEGINVFLCDGEAAFQTVFHFHLHVIPRYAGDGWTIIPESAERERLLLHSDAQAIRNAIASTD